MKKTLLTPKRAQKIQDDLYHCMSAEKKVRITSQFFVLGRELHKSNIIHTHGTGGTSHKNQ